MKKKRHKTKTTATNSTQLSALTQSIAHNSNYDLLHTCAGTAPASSTLFGHNKPLVRRGPPLPNHALSSLASIEPAPEFAILHYVTSLLQAIRANTKPTISGEQ